MSKEDETKLKDSGEGGLENNEMVDHDDHEHKQTPETSFFDKIAAGIKAVIVFIYTVLLAVFKAIRTCLGFIVYPIKELCQKCYKRADNYMNLYKDTTIHQI